MSVKKIRSVTKNLGQKAVPVLRKNARAKKTIISGMSCAGRKEVCMFNISIKIMII
jgi:hypothetical protein